MTNDLIKFSQLRTAAEKTNELIGQVAGAAADAIEEIRSHLPMVSSATLVAANWIGSGPYTQTISVSGVRADEAGQIVQPVPASVSQDAWETAGIKCTEQGNGTLLFSARKQPDTDVSIFVILQEVLT